MEVHGMHARMRCTMRLAGVAALALGMLVALQPAAAARPRKVANEPYPAELRAGVRAAIRKGIAYLREKQMEIGSQDGRTAFEEAAAVLWVLRRAGVEGTEADPHFQILRDRTPETVRQASLLVLALCAEPLPDGDPFAIEEPHGKARPEPLPDADRELVARTVRALLEAQAENSRKPWPLREDLDPRGGWNTGFRSDLPVPVSDVRDTYLALLALETAARRGIEVGHEPFLAALELLLRFQAPKGPRTTLEMDEVRGDTRMEWSVKAEARGFGWAGGSLSEKPSGYETAAGAVAITICKDALQDRRKLKRDLGKRADEALYDALAWIQRSYAIDENPDPHMRGAVDTRELYHHHWLQALARLAIHLRLRFVKDHDWYREGAELLMGRQREDGSWGAIWWSNCYALLFLQRASLRSITPVITPGER